MIPNSRPDQRTPILAAMLKDAAISAQPTAYTQSKRQGMYTGTRATTNRGPKRCSAEDRQRDGEAHVAQGHDLLQAVGLGDLVFRGQCSDHEEREAGAAHCDHEAWAHRRSSCTTCPATTVARTRPSRRRPGSDSPTPKGSRSRMVRSAQRPAARIPVSFSVKLA